MAKPIDKEIAKLTYDKLAMDGIKSRVQLSEG